MSSSTTDDSNSHVTTNTGEIPTLFGLPWTTRTFNPSFSNVTPTMHTSSYPAINPALNPLISHTGKTVLITGATAGIGLAMAKSFVTASASKVIITGRKQERLDKAVGILRQHAKELGKQTEVVGEKSDAAKMEEIDALWKKLGEEGEVVDVLILNAVGEMAMGRLCEEGGRTTVEIWGKLEANLRGPMRYTELFMKQGKKDRQKVQFVRMMAGVGGRRRGRMNGLTQKQFLINISTASAHISHPEYSPALAACSEYGFTKATAGLFFRYIAQQSDTERLQVVSFHPGTIYSEMWQGLGVEKNILPFDDSKSFQSIACFEGRLPVLTEGEYSLTAS